MTPTYLITVINCMWMGTRFCLKERGILSSYCCIVVLLSYWYFLLFLCICFDAGMVVWCICSTGVTGNKNLYRCFVRRTNKIKDTDAIIRLFFWHQYQYVSFLLFCAIKILHTKEFAMHVKRDHKERCVRIDFGVIKFLKWSVFSRHLGLDRATTDIFCILGISGVDCLLTK